MNTCEAKHCKYQPTNEEFHCPKCGAKMGDFCIDEPDRSADSNCKLLHNSDFLLCYTCKYSATGKDFSAAIVKKKNLIPCPHCKGKGFVNSGKCSTEDPPE